jgi:hypothetical protein
MPNNKNIPSSVQPIRDAACFFFTLYRLRPTFWVAYGSVKVERAISRGVPRLPASVLAITGSRRPSSVRQKQRD